MAISKKGLRTIVVNDRKYYWKFKEKVFIFSDQNEKSHLVVDFGWFDIWLYVNDDSIRPPEFEPKKVTPKFISNSISYAVSEGWNDGNMEIEFKNGIYTLRE